MFTLGFNEFIRNIKKNILIIVQMVIVYVIAIFVISAFEEQYRLIDGVSEVFDDTGLLITSTPVDLVKFIKEEELKEVLLKVENIGNSYYFNIHDDKYKQPASIVSYNPEVITYIPKLIEGQWCEDAQHEEGVINTVVANNLPFEVNIGEIIEYAGYRFKVTGKLSTNEMVFNIKSSFNLKGLSHLDFYQSMNEERLNSFMFLVSYEDMLKMEGIDTSYPTLWGTFTIIDFEDDITDEEIDHNMNLLAKEYNYLVGAEMWVIDEIYEYSWKLVEIKVMPMVMLLIVVIIVLIVSLVISSAINILYEKKNYGIYFICGNDWKNTFKFSAVSWFIVAVTSLILSGCVCMLIASMDAFKGLALTFTSLHATVLLGITVMLLIIAVFIPFFMIRKIQPVSILKDNN